MSYRFTRQRVRLAVDIGNKSGRGAIVDAITGGRPKFARAAGLQIEVTLLYNGAVIDISNIPSATCTIKSGEDPDDSTAMTRTIGPERMNRGITDDEWLTGEADKCHFLFVFSSSETADGVFGTPTDEDTHWLVLSGLTDDDGVDVDVFGVGLIDSFDAGLSAVGAPPGGETAATMAQITALLQDYIKKINEPGVTVTFVSPTTGRRVKFGAADTGDPIIDTQPQD